MGGITAISFGLRYNLDTTGERKGQMEEILDPTSTLNSDSLDQSLMPKLVYGCILLRTEDKMGHLGGYPYKAKKRSQSMVLRQMSHDYQIRIKIINPWVRTQQRLTRF